MIRPDDFIIGHRGESFDAPENTLASINLAWERKIKSVEVDIHLTSDNEIVVIHDNNTQRISGKKITVKDSTLAELKRLNAGFHKGENWKGEVIPTLKEVLNTVPEEGRLIIEIKSSVKILKKLQHELSQSGLKEQQIEIIAFNRDTLAKAKQIMPEFKMLWLLDLDYSWPWWLCLTDEQKIIRKAKESKFDGVDVWAGKILSNSFIDKLKKSGLLVYAWTVNNPDKARWLIESGIDGITSDRAHWLAEQLK